MDTLTQLAELLKKKNAIDSMISAQLGRAAEKGHVGAQYSLAAMLTVGRGVKQSDAEAVKWYRRAAEQGDALAQYNLGDRSMTGRSVPQDPVEAYKWFSLASAQGLPDAAQALDGLKKNMTSKQLSDGQHRVEGFTAKKQTNAPR